MNRPALAVAADFQAAWYYSLLLCAIQLLVVVGTAYGLLGTRRMWRAGERGPAAVIAGAIVFSLLAFVGMYATGIGALIAIHGGGT